MISGILAGASASGLSIVPTMLAFAAAEFAID